MGLDLQYQVGQTPLNKNEMSGLKIKSITTQSELDELEQLNIEKAIEWTINTRLKTERILTEKFVKDLHKRMYGDVWKWAGEFRKSDKNIGVQWTQIRLELKNTIDDTIYWIENNTYSSEEIAIRFKHRIVSIHCFPNGNGRHSRLMADIIMEFVFKDKIFTWHKSNMLKADEVRKKYIEALRNADNREIQPLIDFAKS
ncbi:MAG: cell filamentation protein Fic [Ignavibacteriae bacterium HGW-Ignavibacteriae-4]|jgi:Fic-DOC domain mobile mystery protein B|nr:MAG: cell filamentation protein Fic [Ignavibacteriae bacterium HGW-Ignavibacteriae-4]